MYFRFLFLFISLLFPQKKCEFHTTFNSDLGLERTLDDTIIFSYDRYVFSPSGEFKIHFDSTGIDAPNLDDLDLNGIPDYVDMVGSTIDYVKLIICDIMGFKSVPANNDSAYPIFISNRSNGSYGVNYSEGQPSEAPYGWIEIDNNYFVEEFSDLNGNGQYDSQTEEFVDSNGNGVFDSEGYYTSGITAMQVTVAHEYFHAVQRKYRQPNSGDSFFFEFSSTWIEELIFPDHNDYIFWVDDFYDSPSTTFNLTNGYSVASYGHYLNTIMEELEIDNLLSNDLIRNVWEEMDDNSESPIYILDQILAQNFNSSFLNSWTDFIARNYFNGFESIYHYHPDQIDMQYISNPNPVSFNFIHNEQLSLYDDRVSLYSINTSSSGLLAINHNGNIPKGKIVKLGDSEMIYSPSEEMQILINNNDVLKFIYYNQDDISLNIDFELQLTPNTPYNITAIENGVAIEVRWSESINAGDSLKYFIYRNTNLHDSTHQNYYLDEDVEKLEEYYYQVQSQNENGYSGLSSGVSMILWHENTSIQKNQIISIYPNGVSSSDNEFNMVLDSDQIFQSPTIQLFNIRGQFENSLQLMPIIKGRQRIDISELIPINSHSGVYIIYFCFDDLKCSTHKITWLK